MSTRKEAQLVVRIDQDVREGLEQIAREKRLGLSQLIRALLTAAVEIHAPEEDDEEGIPLE